MRKISAMSIVDWPAEGRHAEAHWRPQQRSWII